jgi:hypothetical protein
MLFGKFHGGWMPCDAAYLVADPIDDGLAQVGLHCADVPWFEDVESLKGMQRRVLHEITRVDRAACRHRQFPVGPPLEVRQAPLEQGFNGHAVTRARLDDQLHRRLVAQERIEIAVHLPYRCPSCGVVGHGRLTVHHIDLLVGRKTGLDACCWY